MIGNYRDESSNEDDEGRLHLRNARLTSTGEAGREERGISVNFFCVNCDEIDSAEGDQGGRLSTE